MAKFESDGLHEPNGLRYLREESVLTPGRDLKQSDYKVTYQITCGADGQRVTNEIFIYHNLVVWTRDNNVKGVFDLAIEGESIEHVFATSFADDPEASHHPDDLVGDRSGRLAGRSDDALVAVLRTQAHIFCLSGSIHVVPLPFEVAHAVPCASGFLLQTYQNRGHATHRFGTNVPTSKSIFPTYAFTNLLADFTVVAAAPSQRPVNFTECALLPSAEEILYLSTYDELEQSSECDPLHLAVTFNRTSSKYTIWRVRSVDADAAFQLQSNSELRRRQSSNVHEIRGDRVASGTMKSSDPAKDTFGGLLHSFVEPQAKPAKPMLSSIEDLAAELGREFEPSGAQTRSARRISSMLARSDLAGPKERSAFNDSNHAQFSRKSFSRSLRREGSSASFHARESFDGRKSLLANSIVSNTTSAFDGLLTLPSTKSVAIDLPLDLRQDEESLRLERSIAFTRLKSFQAQPQRSDSEDDTVAKVLILPDPVEHRADSEVSGRVLVCVLESHAETMTANSIVTRPILSNEKTVARAGVRLSVRAAETHLGTSIADACVVQQGDVRRLLVLTKTLQGDEILHLEAPWSMSFRIQLPERYNKHSLLQPPQQLSIPRRHTEVHQEISAASVKHIRLLTTNCIDRLLIGDQQNRTHAIRIRMQPRTPSVRRMIKLISFVLPLKLKESPLLAYWEVSRWLEEQNIQDDSGWTALTMVIFSMAVPFIPAMSQRSVGASVKRKGVSIRSTSGNVIDASNIKIMLSSQQSSTGIMNSAWAWSSTPLREVLPPKSPSKHKRSNAAEAQIPIQTVIARCIELTRDFLQSPAGETMIGTEGYLPTAINQDRSTRSTALANTLIVLYLFREEQRLDNVAEDANTHHDPMLLAIIAQLGFWLRWKSWSLQFGDYFIADHTSLSRYELDEHVIDGLDLPIEPFPPTSVFEYVESHIIHKPIKFHTLTELVANVDHMPTSHPLDVQAGSLLPHLTALERLFSKRVSGSIDKSHQDLARAMPDIVDLIYQSFITSSNSVSMRPNVKSICSTPDKSQHAALPKTPVSHSATRDYRTIGHIALDAESKSVWDTSQEHERQTVSKLLFGADRRFFEATKLVNQTRVPEIEFEALPNWSEAEVLEAQKLIAQYATKRTFSMPAGRGMMHFDTRVPLVTECVPIPRFSMQCVIRSETDTDAQPMTFNADRTMFTEDKSCWAFFHNGASAGLMISRDARWIDTSWILYNKPNELTNRHAGFLMALGLNGHLKTLAKWVAFKYLTPKHTMTSIGLLLGLAASYLGTADTLITRLLSVHVMCLMPPGAAELNLSVLTQTTALLGVGLLYHDTQHRRMSEVMLSEVENQDSEEQNGDEAVLRDEGYRLAAGISLGLINIGQGQGLHALRDMRVNERLLKIAVATKNVDLVHVLDRATAGAIIAIMFIHMKTNDAAIARKVDIPDTQHQFEYVRADVFLLRTLARHIIMWDNITASKTFIRESLPSHCRYRSDLIKFKHLATNDLPLFHIIAGLCFSIALRYAGSHDREARDVLVQYLDQFIRLCRIPALTYDAKVTLNGIRNCLDILALSCATVMAGSGDLVVFRRLRALHSRTDKDTPFGSHMAAHMAIGALFLSGGTATFGTSNLAVASLIMAFYPSFPTDMLDNRGHLQALRHFWVLAVEHRCLTCRAADTNEIVAGIDAKLEMVNGTSRVISTPTLVPDLHTVRSIRIANENYWNLELDLDEFVEECATSDSVGTRQSLRDYLKTSPKGINLLLRRRALYDRIHVDAFSAALQALDSKRGLLGVNRDSTKAAMLSSTTTTSKLLTEWIFGLSAFEDLDHAERELVLEPNLGHAGATADDNKSKGIISNTIVDTRLELDIGALGPSVKADSAVETSLQPDKLWQVRLLLAWTDQLENDDNDDKITMDGLYPGDGPGQENASRDLPLRKSFIEGLRWKIWTMSNFTEGESTL